MWTPKKSKVNGLIHNKYAVLNLILDKLLSKFVKVYQNISDTIGQTVYYNDILSYIL